MAQRGDFNAVFPGNLEDCRALLRFDLITIYVHTNFHDNNQPFSAKRLVYKDCAKPAGCLALAALDADLRIDHMGLFDLAGNGLDRAVACAQRATGAHIRSIR